MNKWINGPLRAEANEAALPEGGGGKTTTGDPGTEQPVEQQEEDTIDLEGEDRIDLDEQETQASPPEGNNEAPEYAIAYPEDFSGDDALKSLIAEHGSKAGIPADAMSAFVASMDAALAKSQEEQTAKSREAARREIADLKTEWGADYNARLTACRRTASLVAKSLGCTVKDVAAMGFGTAAGTRILHSISQLIGEPGLKGQPSETVGGRDTAIKIARDPNHPLYKAFHDASDPRHGEAESMFNKLYGI